MSREIKFRAWNVNTKRMADWEEVRDEYGFKHLLGNDITVPLQFTGLLDKNGKEIYEGDIVEQLDLQRYPELGDKSRQTVEVKFNPTAGYNIWPADCEVIGNIYENPDLLKGEPNE